VGSDRQISILKRGGEPILKVVSISQGEDRLRDLGGDRHPNGQVSPKKAKRWSKTG